MTFECVDITHKPKRMQGDSFRKNDESISCVDGSNKGKSEGMILCDLPVEGSFITLEKAIDFYEKNSQKSDIFKNTAFWLKDLLVLRKSAIQAAKEQVQADLVNEENN